MIIQGKIDSLGITETKTDSDFPLNKFAIQGYWKPYRFDRSRSGGGVFIYIREDIPDRELEIHNTSENVEIVFLKTKKLSGCLVAAITQIASKINTRKNNRKIFKTFWWNYACWWFQSWRIRTIPIKIPLWIEWQKQWQEKNLFWKCIES